jgi:hypothetical protein
LLLVNTEENNLKIPDEIPPEWWYTFDDVEQWDYFRQMAIEYNKIKNIYHGKLEIIDELKNQIKENNKFLKSYNPFKFNHGFNFNLILLFDSKLSFDIILNLNYYHYFFNGRFFITPGIDLKYFKEVISTFSGIGGGLNLGFGFNF